MRIAFFGDIVGRPGREAVKARFPLLKTKLGLDAIIANGENAAGGIGMTKETMREIFSAGADVVTGGNHTWRNQEVYAALNDDPRIVRPANVSPAAPGKGHIVHELACGVKIAVINLLGRSFMDMADCPFRTVDAILASLPEDAVLRFVDFHAEATSEKRAMGHYLDGKVSAVVGTHTHVQTADAAILPRGTAYMTDLGMCGAEDVSILGMEASGIIKRFVTGLPVRFKPAPGQGTLNGMVADFDPETGKAKKVTILREKSSALHDPAGKTPFADAP